jgi:hypothetical protein
MNVSEILSQLERVRALDLSPDVQAALDSAILVEHGIRKSQAVPAGSLQLDIFNATPAPAPTVSHHKASDSHELRMLYQSWATTDAKIAKYVAELEKAVDDCGGRVSTAAVLGCTFGRLRGYLEAYTVPSRSEVTTITTMAGLNHESFAKTCNDAFERINQLRAQHGIRLAVRRDSEGK